MSGESNDTGQQEIDKRLNEAQSVAAGNPEGSAPAAGSPGGASLASDELQSLLQSATADSASTVATAPTTAPNGLPQPQDEPPPTDARAANDVDVLFNQAAEALNSIDQPTDVAPPGLTPFELSDLTVPAASTEKASLDLLRDVELDLTIELGRAQLDLEDVLSLRKGSVLPLNKLAGDPVDIFVNGRLIARGEVLVLNDNFCVRVTELVAGDAAA